MTIEDEDHNDRKGKLEEDQYQLSMDDMHDQLFNWIARHLQVKFYLCVQTGNLL